MHEKLWEGVELKISNAEFFLDQMGIASAVGADFDEYRLPRCAQTNYGTRWQRSFYAHLDAFLAMGRGISEIISCRFGADLSLAMKSWFNGLDAAEKNRRRMFSKQFQADHNAFAKLPLTNARNITFHRTGFANVTVTISGHFGVTYTGSPVRPVPSTETRRSLLLMIRPIQQFCGNAYSRRFLLNPNGRTSRSAANLCFPSAKHTCNTRRTSRSAPAAFARRVHGSDTLTAPPG